MRVNLNPALLFNFSAIEGHPSEINYCPLYVLDNNTFSDPKFLKWAQIFYGITFLIMCLAVLHFYDIHKLLGPLAISIGRMLKDLAMFIFILAVFLIPYGVITTALLYPNEMVKIRIELPFEPFLFQSRRSS